MKTILLPFFTFLFLIITSCGVREEKKKENNLQRYYDLSHLLKNQIVLLKINPGGLHKFVFKDSQQDHIYEKNPDWDMILSPFLELDINKPAWSWSFQTEVINQGDSNAIDNIFYKLLPGATNIPVKKMKIYGYNKHCPDSLSIRFEEENLLYFSRKNLSLLFSDSLIHSVKIEGVQKIFWMDTVRFGFRGRVGR